MVLGIHKRDPYLILFFISLVFLLFMLLACLFTLKYLSQRQINSAKDRYDAYVLATELRQSSDDLSKMIRLYVMTGDKKYIDYFNEILTIRNGTSPRPVCYHYVYWDLILEDNKRPCPNGPPKSIIQELIDEGFTLEEFNLLKEAQAFSNELVLMERRAINAMSGKFEDSTGEYTVEGKPNPELAKSLVFGKEYMKMKSKIMQNLHKFYLIIEQKINAQNERLNEYVTWLLTATILLAVVISIFMLLSIFKVFKNLSIASKENEMLLLNILPQPIAERLKGGEKVIADEYPQASVLFADIVDFTSITYKLGVAKMVDYLGELYDRFDDLTIKHGVEKVKTIGDNYMAVAGVPIPVTDHAMRLAEFAFAIKEEVKKFNLTHNMDFHLRMGMTYGTVVAGVIGHKKFIYDIWGDVVNTASRMESTAPIDEIQITEKMSWMLNEQFEVVERNNIEVKGKGVMKTFLLKGYKPEWKAKKQT